MKTVEQILQERGNEYGSYEDVANTTENIIYAMGEAYSELEPCMKVSLFMIANKISRILNGNNKNVDSWKDIAGYAELVVKEIER